MSEEKTSFTVFAAILSLTVVFLGFYSMTLLHSVGFEYRNLRCIDYFLDGSLYGGQLECVQPPGIFALGALLRSLGDLQTLSNAVAIVLHASCLFLVLLIVRPVRQEIVFCLAFMYAFLVIPLSLEQTSGSVGVVFLDAILSTFFMMVGVFIYRCMSGGWRLIGASVFLTLSLATKAAVLPIALGLLISHFIAGSSLSGGRTKSEIRFGIRVPISVVRDCLVYVLPFFIVFASLYRVYPKLFVYVFLAHTHMQRLGFLDALSGFILTSPVLDAGMLIFYCLLALALWYYHRSHDGLALVFIVGWVIQFVSFFKIIGEPVFPLANRYTLFVFPLLIIVCGNYLSSIADGRILRRLALLFVLGALFLGGYHLHDRATLQSAASMALARFTGVSDEYELLKSEVDVLASKVDGVYGLLPANVGSVLVDEEMYRLIAAHPSKLDLGLVENRNNPPEVNRYLDEWFTPGLLYYQATNRSMYELNDDELALARRIESGRYDMIFVSPSERETQIYYALRNVTPEYISRYCIVFLPNYKDSKTMRHWSTMIFRNWADCDSVLSSSRGYYLSQFDDVCALSEWSANDLLKGMFVANRAPEAFTLNCTSGSDLPSRMLKLEQQYKNTDLKVPAIMLFGILWYLLLTFGRIDENGKKT